VLRIFFEIKSSIAKCALSDASDIASIGIDTWGVDYGLLDKNGRLLMNPYHYRDQRTDNILEYAFAKVSADRVYDVTGLQFMNFNTIFQLLASLRDEPKVIEYAEKLLFTPDLLNYFLTGEMQTEYTIASTSALLNAKERNWAFDLMNEFGIKNSLFTDIYQPGTTVGKLLPSIKAEVGNINANVVHAASHDTASAVVAVPAKGEDFVYISSGTWSLMGTEISEPIINKDSFSYNFTNEGGYGKKIRFLKNIMGLWLEQESRRQWKREGKEYSYNDLSALALEAEPLRCFINPDDQVFSAPGDMPSRIADYCRKTGQYVPQTVGEIIRCIFDSLALKYRNVVEIIDKTMNKTTTNINIVGGGTKEEMLCQFTANACGRTVYAGPVEATAIGNIAVQAMALGEIKDVEEARHVIRNSFEIQCYEPKDSEMWDEAYERFKKVIA